MAKIRFGALDGSKTNFGIAIMDYDTDTGVLSVADLILIKTEKSTVKTVRISSDNFRRAREIAEGLREAIKDCAMVFAEIPYGGQDANSCLAFGIVIGLYASVVIPVVEVSPSETKMAAVGTNTASKQEMILWAVENFPRAPWRLQERNGAKFKKGELKNDNEHLADAVAIAHAGTRTPVFKQVVAITTASTKAA